MSRPVGTKTRVLVRVELDLKKNASVFRYDPRPERWRYDGCTVDEVLGRFNQAVLRFTGKPMQVDGKVNEPLRRAIQNELQVVLDALVDAGYLWCVDEGKAS